MLLKRRSLLAMIPAAALAARPHVVFVTGDDEYRSEVTMPLFAKLLEKHHGMRCSVAYARPAAQSKDNIEGLEALRDADLAVFYMRFRALPDAQLEHITRYVESGKPIVGLRTSTHAFLYPKDHPNAKLNDGFGRDVFGQRWIRHHGAKSTTHVKVIEDQAKNPILRGVENTFDVRSWLYEVEPLHGEATRLLIGTSVNPQGKDAGPQPVAWTRSYKRARVFFTTLGHPEDFVNASVRRLVVNGILWAAGKGIPKSGARADFLEPYTPPPTNKL